MRRVDNCLEIALRRIGYTHQVALLLIGSNRITATGLASFSRRDFPVVHFAGIAREAHDVRKTGALASFLVAWPSLLVGSQEVAHALWKKQPILVFQPTKISLA